jgi:hypothetical protein
MISLLGAWKSQLVSLKAEIDQALGDLPEGFKGFGLGLSQNPKLVWHHKGGWRWASMCKSKIQPKSRSKSHKIGLASRDVVLVLAALSKVVLLPEIVSEEARQNGLLPETVKLGNQISSEV